jgi:site-specific DNA recombinase
MTPILRCATYARYSSSQQRDASIVDQQRNMMRFAETKGWRILTDFMFSDEAISGAGLIVPASNSFSGRRKHPRVLST